MDRYSKLCRLCMVKEEHLIDTKLWDLFDEDADEIREQIRKCTGILVKKDGLPTGICTNCLSTINNFHAFLDMVEHSEIALRKIYSRHENVFSEVNKKNDEVSYLSQLSNEIKELKGQYIKVEGRSLSRCLCKIDDKCNYESEDTNENSKLYINVNDKVFPSSVLTNKISHKSSNSSNKEKSSESLKSRCTPARKCKSETEYCREAKQPKLKKTDEKQTSDKDEEIVENKPPSSTKLTCNKKSKQNSLKCSQEEHNCKNKTPRLSKSKISACTSKSSNTSNTINTSSIFISDCSEDSKSTLSFYSKNAHCIKGAEELKSHKSYSKCQNEQEKSEEDLPCNFGNIVAVIDKKPMEDCQITKLLSTSNRDQKVQKGEDDYYKCEICNELFDTFFDYHDHQFTHNGESVFQCSECNKTTNNREELLEHEKSHKVECTICNLEMLPKSIPAHSLRHTDRHQCPECSKQFSSNAILTKHIKARHLGIKENICFICGKQTSTQGSLKRHLLQHTNERPYPCEYCDFTAKTINVLKGHIARKHFPSPVSCRICNKIFKSKFSLQQHISRIHGGRKFECEICGKIFNDKFELKKHSKRHIGQILHECKFCNKDFFTIRKLREHVMQSHKKTGFSCPNCGKDFIYRKYFDNHLLSCEMYLKK